MSGLLSGVLGSLMGGGNSGSGTTGSGGVSASGAGGMVSELFNAAGGVPGIMAKFQQAGLGEKVQSWVGQGGNQSLAPSELTSVFPQSQIESFAAAHGVPAGIATQLMAHLLPHAVDSQTPNGQTSDASGDDMFAGGGPGGSESAAAGAGGQAPAAGGGFNFGGLVQQLMGRG